MKITTSRDYVVLEVPARMVHLDPDQARHIAAELVENADYVEAVQLDELIECEIEARRLGE